MKLTIDMTMKEGEEGLSKGQNGNFRFLGESKVDHLHNVADLMECYTRLKEINNKSKELVCQNGSKPWGSLAEEQFARMFRQVQPEFPKMIKALERIIDRIG